MAPLKDDSEAYSDLELDADDGPASATGADGDKADLSGGGAAAGIVSSASSAADGPIDSSGAGLVAVAAAADDAGAGGPPDDEDVAVPDEAVTVTAAAVDAAAHIGGGSAAASASAQFAFPIPRRDFVGMLVGRSRAYETLAEGAAGHVRKNPITGKRIYVAADADDRVRGYSTHPETSDLCENAFHRVKAVALDAASAVKVLGLASFGQMQKVMRGGDAFTGSGLSTVQLRRTTDNDKSEMTLLGIAKLDKNGDLWEYRDVAGKVRRLRLMKNYVPVAGALSLRFSNEHS